MGVNYKDGNPSDGLHRRPGQECARPQRGFLGHLLLIQVPWALHASEPRTAQNRHSDLRTGQAFSVVSVTFPSAFLLTSPRRSKRQFTSLWSCLHSLFSSVLFLVGIFMPH